MTYKNFIKNEGNENNNLEYLKCLAEGMHDWLEIKAKLGDEEILSIKANIEKEIDSSPITKETSPIYFSSKIAEKMKLFGISKDKLSEFKGIFSKKLKSN